ncbi:MAG: M20 family metallopeptidase [Trueperaceae bacterium]|nr:M20 family metallopeptidase [Trueperaceae bacterium]
MQQSMTQGAKVRAEVWDAVDRRSQDLVALSHRIHAHPEIRFEEHRASAWLTDALEREGFEVQRPAGGLETAFVARKRGGGGDGPTVAILCEYDALEGLGHACGHNVIATIGLGGGLALGASMDQLPGELRVIGCPGEEGGGGKAYLVEAGVFDDVDAAMMIHPLAEDRQGGPSLARVGWDVTFTGEPAHAAMAPHLGVNALDAVRLAFSGLDAMRQQVTSDVRLHGIVREGGDAANIIPERASMRLLVRCADRGYLFDSLVPRARNVLEGAALMTGCDVEVNEIGPAYENMIPNRALAERYAEHARSLGRSPAAIDADDYGGSTDMGNVSQRLPALHAYIAIDDEAKPHTAPFEIAAASPRGDAAVVDGAKLLAALAADVLTDPDLLARARAERAST